MVLENSLDKIRSFILDRYKDNTAAILIFGSGNTKPFVEGESDIDTFIIVKQKRKLNFEEEMGYLREALKAENFTIQYFYSLDMLKKELENKISWSSYITLVSEDGSRVLYSTPKFEEAKRWLINHPPSRRFLKNYLEQKDKFELDGYFKECKGFDLTKALMSHLRRKLQIINYFKKGNLIFDYLVCLNNSNLTKDETKRLKELYLAYEKRRSLSGEEVNYYKTLARRFTIDIIEKILEI